MYCPHCGVNNDRGEANCFICHKPMPSFDAPAPSRARGSAAAKRDASLTIASVGDRMIAMLFDRVIVVSIVLVLVAWVVDARYQFASPVIAGSALAAAFVIVTFLYHFISEAAFLTTMGKAAMGLHVGVEDGGNRVGGTAIRNALRIVDGIGMYVVGFLFATFGSKRQRVGDLVGRTVVVEWPVPRGGRATVMVLVIAIAGAAVWVAMSICPACAARLTQELASLLHR
jgi:uncharacterized RDD family membrane protein YckC